MATDMIRKNLEGIQQRIDAACARSGRKAEEVRLMAVSKTRSREEIEEAYTAGMRLFGENRVQEAAEKFPDFHNDAELHLIGHLQSNKAKHIVGICSCVQSIDKLSTAEELDKRCSGAGINMDILLEYNTSGEESKSGLSSEDAFFRTLEGIILLPRLHIRGLMTVGPLTDDEGRIRASFRYLKGLYQRVERDYPDLPMDTLSMGMSGDFEWAIEEGSTLIRVGTALFGPRVYP